MGQLISATTAKKQNLFKKEDGLAKVAGDFVTLHGGKRKALVKFLQKEYKKLPSDNSAHDLLGKISHFRTIFTTNYDQLIENCYTKKAVVFTKPLDIGVPLNNKINIFKLHGDIDDPDSMVITEKDYANFYHSIIINVSNRLNPNICDLYYLGNTFNDPFLIRYIEKVVGRAHM